MTTEHRLVPRYDSAIPVEVQQRRANGEDVDVDGWTRKRDLKDEALEDMRNQLADARAERDRWKARVLLLEARFDVIRMVSK